MSNPYDILRKANAFSRPRPRPSVPGPAARKEKSRQPLSQVTKKKAVSRPENLRFLVKPRFRFELPDPPMDMKMMLGRLPTAHYADPLNLDIEHNIRPTLHPSTPTFGINPNLIDTSIYAKPANMNIEDQALLQDIFAKHKGADIVAEATEKALGKKNTHRVSRITDTIDAPWMRRMSYDEYFSQDKSNIKKNTVERRNTLSRINARMSGMKGRSKPRTVAQTFEDAKKTTWKHPDPRKQHLKPVSVSQVFPDFNLLGEKFVILEFDNEENMTVSRRLKKNNDGAEESVKSTATVPIMAGGHVKKDQHGRNYVAMYTPTAKVLQKRKRREEQEANDTDEPNAKRILFSEVEDYQWISEFAARELNYDNPKRAVSRSVFAVMEHNAKDGRSYATFAKVGGTWKMSKRPVVGDTRPLAKDGLRITRDLAKKTGNNRVRRAILSGSPKKEK